MSGKIVRGSALVLVLGLALGLLLVLPPSRRAGAAQAPPLVQSVGQVGGSTETVAVEGTTAYLGVGPRLVVASVADPDHPQLLGQSAPLGGQVRSVAVAGGRAYVSAGAGLRVFDVSEPSRPRQVGALDTGGLAGRVVVDGGRGYLVTFGASTSSLRVLDLSDPAHVREVGSYGGLGGGPGPGYGAVAVVGRYAYVGVSGLDILDVSRPSRPVQVGRLDLGPVLSVAASGGYVYAITYSSALNVVSVANPASPFVVSRFIPRACPPQPGGDPCPATDANLRALALVGRYLYLVGTPSGAEGVLNVVDVADPTRPTQLGRYDAAATGWSGAVDLAVADGRAYLAAESAGLRALGVADVNRPVERGAYATPATPLAIASSGRYAYLAAGRGGLQVVDLADPAGPSRVGGAPAPFVFGYQASFTGVAVAGSRAYTVDETFTLRVFDLGDPTAPVLVGSYRAGTNDVVAARGRYVFLGGRDGLQVIDATNPADLRPVGAPATTFAVSALALDGDRLYAVSAGGLLVFDLTDPSKPRQLGVYARSILRVAVAGRYAYVTPDPGAGELDVVDVADPTHPVLVGVYRRNVVVLAADARFVYVRGDGVRVLDAGDPPFTTEVGAIRTGADAFSAVKADGLLLLAEGSHGLEVFRIVNQVRSHLPLVPLRAGA